MDEQFSQVTDAHAKWFSTNIARCEAERDRSFGKTRVLWNDAIATYKHLMECKLHHRLSKGKDLLCKMEVAEDA